MLGVYLINYRSFKDLSNCIKKNVHKLPSFDLIVGIPRSGMIPAYMIGMFLNKKVCSIDELINGILPSSGYSREIENTSYIKDVLIVDDSIHSGVALNKTKDKLYSAGITHKYKIKYLAIYAREQSIKMIDYYFEIVPLPRVFQWNYLNVKRSDSFCYDIDGVLCVDPTNEENDDGEKYRNFILNAKPLYIPKSKIYAIVTSRLEKYRPETETWLKNHNIRYDNLFMLDVPSKEDRIRLNCHAKFKAEIYSLVKADLFIESNDKQAKEIAEITGRQTICVETDNMYCGKKEIPEPIGVDYELIEKKKILLFSHEFTYTGAPHSLLRIAKVLLKNNYYVEVWGPKYGVFVKEFVNYGIKVRIVPYSDLKLFVYEEIISHFDLAIVNTAIPWQYYRFSEQFVPTIWYIREATNLEDICRNVPQRAEYLTYADRLYCVSDYARNYIKGMYNDDVVVVNNCVEDESSNPYYHKHSISDVINFIQMGSISERKSFDVIVDAFEKIPEGLKSKAHLYLAGQLIESMRSFWEPLLERISHIDNITYLGEIKDIGQKISVMCDMDVVVVSSRDESCSLVALEGAMLGKALILSENVGAKYIINNDNGWIVKTGSSDALCNSFKEAILNKSNLKEMGDRSRLSYESLASMDKYERDIVEMIRSEMRDVLDYRSSRCTYRPRIAMLSGGPVRESLGMFDLVNVRADIGKYSILSGYYKSINDYQLSGVTKPRLLERDLSKDILDELKQSRADYFIMDLLEERFNLCNIKNCNENVVLTKTDYLMKNINGITINGHRLTKDDVRILKFESIPYKKIISEFANKLKEVISEERIIIVKALRSDTYLDEHGDKKQFDDETLVQNSTINDKLIQLYDALHSELPNSVVIELPEDASADVKHKNGLNPMQYSETTYVRILEKVRSYFNGSGTIDKKVDRVSSLYKAKTEESLSKILDLYKQHPSNTFLQAYAFRVYYDGFYKDHIKAMSVVLNSNDIGYLMTEELCDKISKIDKSVVSDSITNAMLSGNQNGIVPFLTVYTKHCVFERKALQHWYGVLYSLGVKSAIVEYVNLAITNNDYRSVSKNITKLLDSAISGNYKSYSVLGKCYLKGYGVKSNRSIALKYYREVPGNVDVAVLNSGVSLHDCLNMLYESDDSLALRDFINICNDYLSRGNNVAAAHLALAYRDGKGIEKDLEKSIELMERASGSGVVWAKIELLNLYRLCGTKECDEKRTNLLKECSQSNNKDLLFSLAQMYRNGRGVRKDYSKAEELMELAIANGHMGAINELNIMRREMKGKEEVVSGDSIKMVPVLWDLGTELALKKMVEICYKNQDCSTVANLYLARAYRFGRGVSVDKNESERHYMMSNNFVEYCEYMYELGDCSCVIPELMRLSLSGDKDASFRLAQIYRNGVGVEKDLYIALFWMEKAIKNGHKGAIREQEVLINSIKEYDCAIYMKTMWDICSLTSSSDIVSFCNKNKDDCDLSYYYLALSYLNGVGVPKDLAKAEMYIGKAIELGVEGSEEVIRKIRSEM